MSTRTFLLAALSFIVIAAACTEQTTAPNSDVLPDDSPDPVFKYRIYGSGLNYSAPTFTYTFFIKNEGNIGIVLYIDDRQVRNRDDVFQIGVFGVTGFVFYSRNLVENQFRFGEGKEGHEINPDQTMTVKIVGNITGDYSSPPNAVRLLNLSLRCVRYDCMDDIDIVLLD